jgi:hypothetical protein
MEGLSKISYIVKESLKGSQFAKDIIRGKLPFATKSLTGLREAAYGGGSPMSKLRSVAMGASPQVPGLRDAAKGAFRNGISSEAKRYGKMSELFGTKPLG